MTKALAYEQVETNISRSLSIPSVKLKTAGIRTDLLFSPPPVSLVQGCVNTAMSWVLDL